MGFTCYSNRRGSSSCDRSCRACTGRWLRTTASTVQTWAQSAEQAGRAAARCAHLSEVSAHQANHQANPDRVPTRHPDGGSTAKHNDPQSVQKVISAPRLTDENVKPVLNEGETLSNAGTEERARVPAVHGLRPEDRPGRRHLLVPALLGPGLTLTRPRHSARVRLPAQQY